MPWTQKDAEQSMIVQDGNHLVGHREENDAVGKKAEDTAGYRFGNRVDSAWQDYRRVTGRE